MCLRRIYVIYHDPLRYQEKLATCELGLDKQKYKNQKGK